MTTGIIAVSEKQRRAMRVGDLVRFPARYGWTDIYNRDKVITELVIDETGLRKLNLSNGTPTTDVVWNIKLHKFTRSEEYMDTFEGEMERDLKTSLNRTLKMKMKLGK